MGRTDTTVPGTLTLDAKQVLSSNITEYNWTFTPDNLFNNYVTTGTVSITVVQDDWVNLEIVTPPTKTVYTYGESFDITGIKVVATYLSEITQEIPYKAMDGLFTPYELTAATTEVTFTISNLGKDWTVTQAITVNPKVVENAQIDFSEDVLTYTGEEIVPDITVFDGDVWILASEYTVEITNNVSVGTATVTITDVPGGNYVVSGSGTFEITKANQAELTITDRPGGKICYDDEFVLSVLGGTGSGPVSWEVTEGGNLATVDNVGAVKIIGVGTVIITATKAGDDNYKDAVASFEFVVEKAINYWIEDPSIVGWTYGDFGNTPTATPKFGEVAYDGFSYRLKGTNAWTNSPPSDAGIYELKARVQATDNWELLSTTIEFEIKKATPTIETFDFTLPTNLNACDGLAKEATVTVKEGIEGVGSITITYFKDSNPLNGAPTAIGTYTVKIEVAEGANFLASEGFLTAESWTFTFDVTDDEEAHTNVTLSSNGNGTHDKVCSACAKVIESGITCSGTTTDDCDKGYKCSCGGYFGTKEHNFSGDYLSDSEGHWHKCADCSAIDTKENHDAVEDGNCETSDRCGSCNRVVTFMIQHTFDNACDTDCNNDGCEYTRTTEHIPEADDGDCTTDILCSICDAVTTKGNEAHTGGTASCSAQAVCTVCEKAYGSTLPHSFTVPKKDNTHHWNQCENCDAIDTKAAHSGTDDGNCLTPVVCSCGHIVTVAADAHTGGTATCQAKANCSVCGTAYGEALGHDFRGIGMDENEHWSKCERCDATGEREDHIIDGGLCTVCEYQPPKDGLSGGAIAAIVVASVAVLGGGGFALWWFVFKKKKLI